MAFERLRVERSWGAVWFGAIVIVFAFAGAQGSAGGAFWHPTHTGAIGVAYLGLTLLGAFAIIRGLYGAWWRVVRVDLGARTIRTCDGALLGFADIATLEIDGNRLQTATKTVVYRSSTPDLRHVKALLEALVHAGAPRHLHRLRRLTYHRMWGLFAVASIGFAILVGVGISESHTLGRELAYEPEFKLLWLLGLAVALAWFRLSLFGTFTPHQLHVDPVTGVLQLVDKTIVPLGELGALSIVERTEKSVGQRYTFVTYDLRATTLEPRPLYSSSDRARTQRRLDALAAAILQFELRRALEAPAVDGDAFRSGPDPTANARRIARGSPHATAALRALARDPDPTVRERAAALLGVR